MNSIYRRNNRIVNIYDTKASSVTVDVVIKELVGFVDYETVTVTDHDHGSRSRSRVTITITMAGDGYG